MRTETAKHVILTGQSFIYLIAFTSLYWQIPGLYGENGLLPIASKFSYANGYFTEKSHLFGILPRVINTLKIPPSYALQFITIVAIVLASLSIVFQSYQNTITYVALYAIYCSALNVGNSFLWFQWDTLLLESGAICVLLANIPLIGSSPADNISLFLVRWLCFRLMFQSGLAKLSSLCPLWWSLSALDVHFESQCIPTTLAYYAHQLPQWFLHLSVAATFYILIIVSPLCFFPVWKVRLYAFGQQVFLMTLILFTGNYNFFNLHCALLSVAMLVRSDNYNFSSKGLIYRYIPFLYKLVNLIFVVVVAASLCLFVRYFGISFDGFSISSRILFSKEEYFTFRYHSIVTMLMIGITSYFLELLSAVIRLITDRRSFFSSLLHLIIIICASATLFIISFVPFLSGSTLAQSKIPPEIVLLSRSWSKYQLSHSYGLFRSMTGVEGRPEIMIEGSYDLGGPWKTFDFYAKPCDLDKMPGFIVPHQPRLDWQMWFAALGAYQHNPFYISLLYHLLHNNSDVTYLMRTYPFEDQPPQFIRARLFRYRYTNLWEHQRPKNYWKREFQEEYSPPITRDNPAISKYLHDEGLVLNDMKFRSENDFVRQFDRIHNYIRCFDPAVLIQSIVLAHVVIKMFIYFNFGR